jgi:hypothetical protein
MTTWGDPPGHDGRTLAEPGAGRGRWPGVVLAVLVLAAAAAAAVLGVMAA